MRATTHKVTKLRSKVLSQKKIHNVTVILMTTQTQRKQRRNTIFYIYDMAINQNRRVWPILISIQIHEWNEGARD